jgi:hypothetical protein
LHDELFVSEPVGINSSEGKSEFGSNLIEKEERGGGEEREGGVTEGAKIGEREWKRKKK